MKTLLIAALLIGSVASAQTKESKKEAQPQRRTEIVFEADILDGTIVGPSAELFVEPTPPRFKSLIQIRDNFNDKLRASINEL